jgi:hypothetical protein
MLLTLGALCAGWPAMAADPGLGDDVQAQRASARLGRVLIYNGPLEELTDSALDREFERIDGWRLGHVRPQKVDGGDRADDDGD